MKTRYHVISRWSCSLQNKSAIRKILFNKRSQVTADQRQVAANTAAARLLASDIFKSSQHIACYLADKSEFDCTPIIEAIWHAQKHCYLPVIVETQLQFVTYRAGDPLRLNQYKILEPEIYQSFPAEKLNLVLLPLVGFDLQGNRLGRGCAHYDRAFSFILRRTPGQPFLLGVGYEAQAVDQLPNDEWDVKLDGVLTEHRLIICNRQNS